MRLQVTAKIVSFFIFTTFARREEEFFGAINVRQGFLKKSKAGKLNVIRKYQAPRDLTPRIC